VEGARELPEIRHQLRQWLAATSSLAATPAGARDDLDLLATARCGGDRCTNGCTPETRDL
jgi:hypothetical protein